MGLLGCPASFQHLMEKVLDGIQNIIVYIDNVIIHTATHDHHLQVLEQVLAKLEQHQLKINLAKCFFGNYVVAYLITKSNWTISIATYSSAWIHCPGRGPDVPKLKAQNLPLKYRQPVICNFRQRQPDIPVKDEMQKLQENYSWVGMREDIATYSATCNNCQVLQHAKKTPEVPNATVHLDVHGAFVSYGENKFVVTLTDEATKLPFLKPSSPNQRLIGLHHLHPLNLRHGRPSSHRYKSR